jgi:hypothetical protein
MVHLSSLALLLEDIGQTATSAVLTIVVPGHEDTGSAGLGGALTAETGDLAVTIDLVELEDGQLDLSLLVLDLLGGGVGLLLALLASSQKVDVQVEGRHGGDGGEEGGRGEGLAVEGQALDGSGDTLALLDDGLDVADAVTGLGVDGHSAGKGLHKELHGCVWWNFSK